MSGDIARTGNGFLVDDAGLGQFANSVADTTSRDFRPTVEQVFDAFKLDGTFGADTASAEVQAARLKHHAAMESAAQAMASLVNASEDLILRIADIRRQYASSDALAKAKIQDVLSILESAPPPSASPPSTVPETAPQIGVSDRA